MALKNVYSIKKLSKSIYQDQKHKLACLYNVFAMPESCDMIYKYLFEMDGGHFRKWPILPAGSRSRMPPSLELFIMMYTNNVPSFILLS